MSWETVIGLVKLLSLALSLALLPLTALDAMAQPASQPSGPSGPAPGGRPQLPPQIQQKLMELQGLQQKLDQLHRQALSDPKIQKKVSAFQTRVETAMRKNSPKVAKALDRFKVLSEQFDQARQKKDEKAMRALAPELQELGQTLTEAQAKAVASGPLEKDSEKLHKTVLAQMSKIDPKTNAYEARVAQLQQELQAALGPKPAP